MLIIEVCPSLLLAYRPLSPSNMGKANIPPKLEGSRSKGLFLYIYPPFGSPLSPNEFFNLFVTHPGDRFKDFPHEIKGNNDLLSLTRPDVILKIHKVRTSVISFSRPLAMLLARR